MTDSRFDVSGKIALVTGASSGLGENFARVLAAAGATVAVAARRTDRLATLVADIERAGGKGFAVAMDVSDPASVEAGFAAIAKAAGAADIIVNNAGVAQAKPSIEPAAVPALKAVLKHPRTALVDLFKLLIEKKAIPKSGAKLPDVQACFKKVEAIYAADTDLAAKHCLGLFHAFVYFCLTDPTRKLLKPFKHWVAGNRLAALKETDAHALIEIFESIHTAKARTIFVSMQFGDETDDTYDTIKRVVDAVNADARPKIKIKPLRIDKLNKGHSYTITDAILTAIEESGLLIADLTHANPNVYHEVGYVMGLNRGRGLKQENFILIAKEESGSSLDKKVGFNLRGVSQIRFKKFADLEAELSKHIRTYYALGEE